jgi:hypothetical protein
MSITQTLENISLGFIAVINRFYETPAGGVSYQDFAQDATTALMLTQIAGQSKVDEDICGGYEVEQNFALYLRVCPESDSDRIEAVSILASIAEQLEQEEYFPSVDKVDFWEVKQTSTPTLIARENDAVRIYQVMFTARFEIQK